MHEMWWLEFSCILMLGILLGWHLRQLIIKDTKQTNNT